MQTIGQVVSQSGLVNAESPEGIRSLSAGDEIFEGDVLVTGAESSVEIQFNDESILAQGENSRLALDNYVYDPQDSSESNLLINMTEGTFRMVTGKIAKANPEGVEIQSPMATIGIRGTGADFNIGPDGMKVGIFQYDGVDLTVTTPAGVMVINNANQILDILTDGSFGEIRSYSELEKVFFKAVAPIISEIGNQGGDDDGEGDGDDGGGDDGGKDGTGGEGEVNFNPTEGFTPEEIIEFIAKAVLEQPIPLPKKIVSEIMDLLEELEGADGEGDDDDDTPQDGANDDTVEAAVDTDPTTGTGDYPGSSYSDMLDGYSAAATDSYYLFDAIDGPDTLRGSSYDDSLSGGDGDDFIDAGEAREEPAGYFGGHDTLVGGAGNDYLRVQSGEDDDTLLGGDGNDTLTSWWGNDYLNGGTGDDSLDGYAGDDWLDGGTGADTLVGGIGYDTLRGEEGNDFLSGDTQDDSLDGGAGNDTLDGGAGDDTLIGGAGDDSLDGGFGVDWADYSGAAAGINADFSGATDTVQGSSTDTLASIEAIIGSEFDDTIVADDTGMIMAGGDGANVLTGGAGNDYFFTGGDDTITGGAGTDTIDFTYSDQGGTLTMTGGGDGTAVSDDGSVTLYGIEVAHGSHYDDTAQGDDTMRTLYGEGGDDSISGGTLADTLYGDDYDGNRSGNDTLEGNAGDDSLEGGAGDDSLVGGDGNDILNSGSGNDTVIGGTGNDQIVVTSGDNDIDGGEGSDSLYYTDQISADLAAGSVDRGSAGTDEVAGIEYLEAGDGDDLILGDDGNNTLIGGGGNDTIGGGEDGNNELFGDGGTNRLTFRNVSSWVDVSLEDGSYYLGEGSTSFYNFTELEGSDYDDILSGSSDFEDFLLGGAGADSLTSNGSYDTLQGGDGDDTLRGGSSTYADFSDHEDGVVGTLTNDTSGGGADFTVGTDTDRLIFIDNVIGSQAADNITGNNYANELQGEDGNDVLSGSAGNDTLYGDDGDDTLSGGIGADSMDGGVGADYVDGGDGNDALSGSEGDDTLVGGLGEDTVNVDGEGASVVNLSSGSLTMDGETYAAQTITNAGGTDSVTDIEHVIGSDQNDTLVGSDVSNSLQGGAGDDLLFAWSVSTNPDTLDGGAGNDWAMFTEGSFGISSGDMSSIVVNGVTTTLVDIENLYGTAWDDTFNGNANANFLDGDDGNDSILGGDGGDTLYGGDGGDILYGEAGDDIVEGGEGDDFLYGGEGQDTLSYYSASAGVFQDMSQQESLVNTIGAGVDAQDGSFEVLEGSLYDDTLYSNDAGFEIDGEEGDDSIVGQDDYGADTLEGGEGDDTLLGKAENDLIYGDDGNDSIDGGWGNDTLSGGSGNDVVLGGTDDDSMTGSDGDDTLDGGDGADTMDGGSDSDSMVGNTGDDSMMGGSGNANDTLDGGEGNDSLKGGDGNNSLIGGTGMDRAVFDAALAVFVDLVAGTAVHGDYTDTLSGIEEAAVVGSADATLSGDDNANNFWGGDGDDHLWGGGGNDSLIGGAGDDFLAGQTGTNSISGGDGFDYSDYSSSDSSISVDLRSGSTGYQGAITHDGGETDSTYDIEGVFGTDHDDSMITSGAKDFYGYGGNDTLTGGGFNDTLRGGDGDDSLTGDAGDDSILGGDGDDTLLGGEGTDTLDGGAGNDFIDGGGGINWVSYASAGAAVNVSIDASVLGSAQETGGAGSDILDNVYRVIGSGFDDSLTGSSTGDSLYGGDGGDTLTGQGGNDWLEGGDGDDFLFGGTGADNLLGGEGSDTYYYSSLTDIGDTVREFHWGWDVFQFENDIFGLDAGQLSADRFFSVDAYTDNANVGQDGAVFIYDPTVDSLYYDEDGDGGSAGVEVASFYGDVGFDFSEGHSVPLYDSIYIVDLEEGAVIPNDAQP